MSLYLSYSAAASLFPVEVTIGNRVSDMVAGSKAYKYTAFQPINVNLVNICLLMFVTVDNVHVTH